MNDIFTTPRNDNNGIPGAEIDRMEGNNLPTIPNNWLNDVLGVPDNEPLPNSNNSDPRNSVNSPNNRTNNQDSNQPSQSNNSNRDDLGNTGRDRF